MDYRFIRFVYLLLVILRDMLDTIKSSKESTLLRQSYDACGNDMLKRMQIVFPIYTKIQMGILRKYGYASDSDGM